MSKMLIEQDSPFPVISYQLWSISLIYPLRTRKSNNRTTRSWMNEAKEQFSRVREIKKNTPTICARSEASIAETDTFHSNFVFTELRLLRSLVVSEKKSVSGGSGNFPNCKAYHRRNNIYSRAGFPLNRYISIGWSDFQIACIGDGP